MRVTTIDGGFRGAKGLGALTSVERVTAAEAFNARLEPVFEARRLFRAEGARAKFDAADTRTLDTFFDAFDAQSAAHLAALDALEGPAALAQWSSEGEILAREALPVANRVRTLLTEEGSLRPWKVAVAAAAVVGGFLGFRWWLG